jgi:cysteinyl-tRNA synthetase
VLADRPYLKWYACGPTVYADAHVGHGRTYVALDMLRRLTEQLTATPVVFQMGITDVDDKILAAAAAEKTDPTSFARKYEARFMLDMAALGVRPPSLCTRVTDHIPQIITYIDTILRHGLAYAAVDGVYFDVAAMGSRYGKLRPSAHHGELAPPSSADGLVRQTHGHAKRDRRDFALWKLSAPSSSTDRTAEWDSPWGRGRPGWHIECSAMTHAALGQHLDFHAGGIDLAFPHHCNEIAQAEAHASSCAAVVEPEEPWVRHWLHTGHVHIDGRKMSKSLKNFITVREMLLDLCCPASAAPQRVAAAGMTEVDADISALPAGQLQDAADAFRFLVAAHHYREDFTYSKGRMRHAQQQVRQKADLLLRLLPRALEGFSEKSRATATLPDSVAASWSADDWATYEVFAEAFHRARSDGSDSLSTSTSTPPARGAVDRALRADFDIPAALKRVGELERLLEIYLADRLPGATDATAHAQRDVLVACGLHLARFYDTLGFTFGRRAVRLLQGCESGYAINTTGEGKPVELADSGGSALLAAQPVAQAFADFRAMVRSTLRELLAKNKVDGVAGRTERQEALVAALRCCDEARDSTFPRLGWTLRDGADGKATLAQKVQEYRPSD